MGCTYKYYPIVSCSKARAVKPGELAMTEVGEVNGLPIYYEEFYFLCENYKEELSANGGTYTQEELKALVWENIIQNAVLRQICLDAGLIYDEEELADTVKELIEEQIAADHDDKRGYYLSWLEYCYMTDHYYRYCLGLDHLYGQLQSAYIDLGTLPSDDNGMMEYVRQNFVNTRHIAIFFDEENREQKLALAEEALGKLNSGAMTMSELIGSVYNEDFGLSVSESYYMSRHELDEAYLAAVYGMETGAYSGIVEAKGENSYGVYSDCFYIIERRSLDDSYILRNLDTLRSDAADALAYAAYTRYSEQFVFTPNEFCLSLNVNALERPE
ncbi:MAG: SurA N-terminal domain-containing protein [Clostridia bacterium]|nr:SurA N-terminal domain-containing protein [Clostridia bacterium]